MQRDASDKEVYCFASPMWNCCVDISVFFDENYRQHEPELIHLLEEFRMCGLSQRSHQFIEESLTRPLDCNPLDVVRLYSHRDNVSQANDECLALLAGEPHHYCSDDSGNVNSLKKCSAPKNLAVKLNARVVLLKNLSIGLVNGLRGTIHSFVDGFPFVVFDNGSRKLIREELFTVEDECTVVATRKQIPLDLAYAMTIHKSQGMAFPLLDVDLSTVFEAGQAYVAVSRATTIHGLKVSSYRERMPQVSQLVIDFYANGVVMASDLNVDEVVHSEKKRDITTLSLVSIDKCISVSSTAKEPKPFVVKEQFLSHKLPQGVMDNVHKLVKKESEISDDVSSVLKKLNLKENEQHELYSDSEMCLEDYCTWLWQSYEQIHSTDKSGTLIDRKNFSGVTKQLHSLYRSSQLLQKWKDCSKSDVDIGIGGKDRKAAIVYARALYAEFVKQQAANTRNDYFNDPMQFEEGPVQSTTKEASGKVRDISGWVIHEEIKSCISYVSQHKCSKSQKVVKEVAAKRKMKAMLDQMKGCKDDVLEKSNYPESLEHIALYDKGGKTYVPDVVFEFFMNVSSVASELLSNKNIHAFKQDALSVVYTKIKSNVELQESFLRLTNNDVEGKSCDGNQNDDKETVLNDFACEDIIEDDMTNELLLPVSDDDLEWMDLGEPSDCPEVHESDGEDSTPNEVAGKLDNNQPIISGRTTGFLVILFFVRLSNWKFI